MTESSYFSSCRSDIHQFVPPGANVTLDVGCGTGQFSRFLKHNLRVHETWGIELDPAIARQAEVDRLLCGDVSSLLDNLPNGYFDCIFFNDVLEHLIDPWTVLKQMKEKLAEGGLVMASIPNIRHYKVLYELIFCRDWCYQDAGILDRTHLRFFTKKSVARLFDEAGYKDVTITGINGTRKSKIRILAPLSFGLLRDIRFSQFVILAK